jgi:hypothetical protein
VEEIVAATKATKGRACEEMKSVKERSRKMNRKQPGHSHLKVNLLTNGFLGLLR